MHFSGSGISQYWVLIAQDDDQPEIMGWSNVDRQAPKRVMVNTAGFSMGLIDAKTGLDLSRAHQAPLPSQGRGMPAVDRGPPCWESGTSLAHLLPENCTGLSTQSRSMLLPYPDKSFPSGIMSFPPKLPSLLCITIT